GATVFVNIFNQFIMPLFFVLSAFAIYYAIQKRTDKQFLSERVNRLLIPLIFGIFTIIIPQVYIERVTHGDFAGNFFQFIPEYFKGWYAFGGNFAWMGLHLWYLLMLFLFSLIMLPVFRSINKADTKPLADFFSNHLLSIYFLFPSQSLKRL
ncbi:MAG TPA: acyltransferase family protein, partial [Anaerolineales bacterium]|nr:acyltransferase family protein [Anaerolineales bacterium]